MFKKITISSFIFLTLFGFIAYSGDVAAAQPVFQCEGTDCGADGGLRALLQFLPGSGIFFPVDGEKLSITELILGWVKFALSIMGTIAFVAFVWAGFLYITAFANEENAETAKKVMIWTSIGIIIILLSYALVSMLINVQT